MVFTRTSAREKVKYIKALDQIKQHTTIRQIEDNIRKHYQDVHNGKVQPRSIVKTTPLNRDAFDKAITTRCDVKRDVADHLKKLSTQFTTQLLYDTSDNDESMESNDWTELASFIPNTPFGELPKADQDHCKTKFLELKHQKKRERKHHEKIERLMKCLNVSVSKAGKQ